MCFYLLVLLNYHLLNMEQVVNIRLDIVKKWKYCWIKKQDMRVINDPLGQVHNLATLFSLEICFVLLYFKKWGRTYGR